MTIYEYFKGFLSWLFNDSAEEKKKIYSNFWVWVFKVILKYFILPLLLLLIFFKVIGVFPLIENLIKKSDKLNDIEFISCITQAIFIFLVILFQVKINMFSIDKAELETFGKDKERSAMKCCGYNDDNKWLNAKLIANRALKDYKTKWYFIWVFWLLLYITLSLPQIIEINFPFKVEGPLLNLFNNGSTLMFIICYLTLAKVTVSDDRTGITETPNWIPWFTIFLIVTLLEIILTILNKVNLKETVRPDVEPFQMICGIAAGTVMALFVGRFDSKFIKAPLLLLILLYMYAVIQALFFIFSTKGEPNLLIINAAFFFKILLFLFMTWLFKSGKLLFYFVRIRRLHYGVDGAYEQFLDYFHDLKETDGRPNNQEFSDH